MAKAQSDTWWQLRSGRDIWEHRSVSFVDTYSHTAHGLYWPNHEWLTEVFFFGAHRTGGMPLLATVCTVAIVTAYAVSWRLSVGRLEVRLGLFVLSLSAAVGAWSMRPQVISMACFMLTCLLLARGRLWWLPPVFMVWANLHAGVAIGLVAVGAVVLNDTLVDRRIAPHHVAVAILCFAATAATPMGVGLWWLLVSYSQRTKTQGISEWMAPGFPPDYLGFWILAAGFVVLTVMRWRRLDRTGQRLTAIALVTLPLALSAHRNVAMFLLTAVPALSRLLAAGQAPPAPPPSTDYKTANGIVVGIAATVLLLFIVFSWIRPLEKSNWTPLTSEAITSIRQCRTPVYNALSLGGEMIGFVPDQPVFIDNRNDPYPTALLRANLQLEQSGHYSDLFRQYGIRCAIVETGSLTTEQLRHDPDWTISHEDRHLVVFERR